MLRLVYKVLDNWPLKNRFGFYAYLPAFFALGASIEFIMIKMRIGNVDFYTVYMQKQQERLQLEAQKLNEMLDQKKLQYTKEIAEAANKPDTR